MNASQVLAKAPQYFQNIGAINHYTPTKITDLYGYQYLLKGNPTQIKGAIHTETFLEGNQFGRFGGKSIILSTQTQMNCGDLIEANGEFYAIAHQKPYNDKMKECDYVCYSIYDYYADFLIDDEAQTQQILGTNSMRYILAMDSDIPLIPSFFTPPTNTNKYISVSIATSRANSITYQNDDNLLQQYKTDSVVFLALNLNTNELMSFEMLLQKQSNFGFTTPPTWREERRYNKEFDLKSNLWRMDIDLNYNIFSNQELAGLHYIKEAFFNAYLTPKNKE